MNNLGKKLTVAFMVWLGLFTGVSAGPARAVEKNEQLPAGSLVVAATGLAGKLVLILNDQEELTLDGNATGRFKSELPDGGSFQVKIKQMPLNQRCELSPLGGVATPGVVPTVKAVCKETGEWSGPGSLADSISPVGGDSEAVTVAINDRANGLAAWVQSFEGQRRIFLREFRDGKWQSPAGLEGAISPAGGKAGKPKVAVAGNGDAVIVWEQAEQGSSRIMLAERRQGIWKLPKSTADCLSIGSKYAWEAEVGLNDAGETLVVWSQESESGVYAIYKSEYRQGKWLHPADLADHISPGQGGDAVRPKVALNHNGATVVVWEQDMDGVNRIFKSEFRDHKWRHPADSNDYVSPKGESNRGAYMPLVAMDAAGNALIAWKQAHANKERIYLSEYRGGRWCHPESLDQAISPPEIISAAINDLSMDDKGNAMLLWSGFKERRQSLYKSEYRQGKWLNPAEGEALVSAPLAWEFYVFGHSAMADDGKAVVAWLQSDETKVAAAYLAEYDNGAWYLPGTQLNLEKQPASGLALAASAKGNVILAWTQRDGKNMRVYGRVFRVLPVSTPATPVSTPK
jgi:uncharacterized protein YheU (UPF0270 family)